MGRNSYNLRRILLTRMVDPRNVLHPEVDHEIRVDWLDILPPNKALPSALWFIVIGAYSSMLLILIYFEPYPQTCPTWLNLPGVIAPAGLALLISRVRKPSH